MDAAAPYAVDEQLRVEALRAAVAYCAGQSDAYHPTGVCQVAVLFERWLLRDGKPTLSAEYNATLEGSD